jgi:WD40 repeat protein
MLTGGDDNAVHLTEVTINPSLSFKSISSVLDAHASTVTGLLAFGRSRYLSVGIDQNICIWDSKSGNLNLVQRFYTFVPDVGGVVEIGVQGGKRRIVIFGTGIEMIALDETE